MFENAIRQSPTRARGLGSWASVLVHALMAGATVWLFAVPRSATLTLRESQVSPAIEAVWLVTPAPDGGGRSPGDKKPEASPAQAIGQDRATVPPPPPKPEAVESTVEPPLDPIVIPAVPVASGSQEFAGLIAPAEAAVSGGLGDGDGPGRGVGNGLDSGIGTGPGGPGMASQRRNSFERSSRPTRLTPCGRKCRATRRSTRRGSGDSCPGVAWASLWPSVIELGFRLR